MLRKLFFFFSLMFTVSAQALPPSTGFADTVEGVLPAVVNISTTQTVRQAPRFRPQDLPQFPPGSPFEEFFRQYFEGMENAAPRKATSLGSGFIIDTDGIIVTNNHVIDGADEITVIFANKNEYKAELIGRDERTDVALLRIKAKEKLTALRWGNSDKARVGDWVLAIGNPFGLGGTVTQGIISARARDINAGPYDDFIQVDAAINRGNSGGPLLNINGEVIGITTAIYSPTGASVGIGFASPSNHTQKVVEQLLSQGKVRRGWLGVKIQPMTEEIAEGLGLKQPVGALIAEPSPNSPAAKAGLQAGDVILSFNGIDINETRTLPRLVAQTPIGKKVPLIIWRDNERRSTSATIGELHDDTAPPPVNKKSSNGNSNTVLGLRLGVIDAQARQRLKLDDSVNGALIVAVAQDSDAAAKGIRPGYVIVAAGGAPVTNPQQFTEALDSIREEGRKSILLRLVAPGGERLFVAIKTSDGE
ncbi:MAG: DegQ family serine endoprotease [Holosporales bacterium]|jgi:serine protease Do